MMGALTQPRGSVADLRFRPAAERIALGLNSGCVRAKRPALERLHAQCERVGECLVWTGAKTRKGYARFKDDNGRRVFVHRFSYEASVGEIPEGLTIDHLCRNRACCEPSHLEPVTVLENIRRGTQGQPQAARTHCPAGHPYAGDNLYLHPRGDRICRECTRANDRLRTAEKRRAGR